MAKVNVTAKMNGDIPAPGSRVYWLLLSGGSMIISRLTGKAFFLNQN